MPLVSILPPENQGDLGVSHPPNGALGDCGSVEESWGGSVLGYLRSVGTSQLLGVAEEAEVICLLPERKTHSGGKCITIGRRHCIIHYIKFMVCLDSSGTTNK